jgi:hypothetical protein
MICLGNIQEPRLLSLDSVWSPCATRCVGERTVGGKNGYGEVFSEYEMMEKGAKEKEQRVFMSSTASCQIIWIFAWLFDML